MAKPTITKGCTVLENQQYPYAGLLMGKTEYRVYECRQGWFFNGDYTAVMPRSSQAAAILRAVRQATSAAFLDYLNGRLEKWELKEKVGV